MSEAKIRRKHYLALKKRTRETLLCGAFGTGCSYLVLFICAAFLRFFMPSDGTNVQSGALCGIGNAENISLQ